LSASGAAAPAQKKPANERLENGKNEHLLIAAKRGEKRLRGAVRNLL
jgi:hypothetical protein